MSLLSFTQAAPLLGCRDPRTAAKRLADLGVPVVELYGRRFVEEVEISRAIRSRARPMVGAEPRSSSGRLAPLPKLWDCPAEGKKVSPRRVSARGRGSRERELRAAREAYPGSPQASLATSSRPRHNRDEEER